MECRSAERRQWIVNKYDVVPVAHIQLLANQTKHSDAGAMIENDYLWNCVCYTCSTSIECIWKITWEGWRGTMKNMKIDANGTEIRVMGDVVNEEAYISLTDIASIKIRIMLLL